ncbi:Flagellar assembly factor FliW [bioreactor metagenome]|uniref:Flagellar assembly factor FliW n=1 Tax=bioreactor metagenome TaxID=1076179 RepID=A0A645E860_9ZZZZ
MKLETAHFGVVEIDENSILHFDDGLPGLEADQRYALLTNEQSKPVSWLQSVDHKEIALPVVDPFLPCPGYDFEISPGDVERLEAGQAQDLFVLNVLVIPEDINGMTVNLSAPIVVNARNKKGRQIILDGRQYRVRMPVSELLGRSVKDGL